MVHAIRIAVAAALWLGIVHLLPADDESAQPPFYKRNAEAIKESLNRNIDYYSDRIEVSPQSDRLYSLRGNTYFFNGDFKKAVADFEKMQELDPAQEASNWRLGLAYYFAGRYEDCSKQLARYMDYDDKDRENGIWIFLADAKEKGVKKAREKMIRYSKPDPRPEFGKIYEMFEGKLTSDELLAAIQKQIEEENLGKRVQEQRLFYVHLYTGLFADAEGNHKLARTSFLQATEYLWPVGKRVPLGPKFMWHCARLRLVEYDRKDEAAKSKPQK